MKTLEFSSDIGRKIFGTQESGNQTKIWLNNGKLLKINSEIRESTKEVSASAILRSLGIEAVKYEKVKTVYKGRGRVGCICDNFLRRGESSIPLWQIVEGIEIKRNTQAKNIFHLVTLRCAERTGIEETKIKDYLLNLMLLDWAVLNSDRHLNNIEVILDIKGNLRLAPYYDFGRSFLGRDYMTNTEIENGIRRYKSKPFSTRPNVNVIDMDRASRLALKLLERFDRDLAVKNGALEFHCKLFKIMLERIAGKRQ
jgi:hypothetical protein